VDLRLDKEGTPYVLEVNVNPDLSRDGAVAKIAQGSRISYIKLIKSIIENAIEAGELNNKETPPEETRAVMPEPNNVVKISEWVKDKGIEDGDADERKAA